jgi:hypothetical protein
MNLPQVREPEPIVEFFAHRMPIEKLRQSLRTALINFERHVFHDMQIPEEELAAAMLLDLLAVHKGWYGYLDAFWDEFETYVLKDVCQNATFDSLRILARARRNDVYRVVTPHYLAVP